MCQYPTKQNSAQLYGHQRKATNITQKRSTESRCLPMSQNGDCPNWCSFSVDANRKLGTMEMS